MGRGIDGLIDDEIELWTAVVILDGVRSVATLEHDGLIDVVFVVLGPV